MKKIPSVRVDKNYAIYVLLKFKITGREEREWKRKNANSEKERERDRDIRGA